MLASEMGRLQGGRCDRRGSASALLVVLFALSAASGSAQVPAETDAGKPATPTGAAPVAAAPPERAAQASHDVQAPRATAVRTLGPISIDGRVDEEAWAVAQPITEFFQTQPSEGDPISRPTDVRFLYDDDALYVGARLHDSDPVFTRLKKRDASFADTDLFAVYIDTYHDHKTAARFTTNPSAVKKDQSMNPDGSNGDTSWDPVWEVETEVTDQGWSVEMRIPFSQLRFSPADEQFWGLQVERRIRSLQEWAVFAFTPLLERGGVARYGHLDGIRGIQPGRPLELLPYVGGRAGFVHAPRSAEVDFENPFRDARDFGGQVGLDLK